VRSYVFYDPNDTTTAITSAKANRIATDLRSFFEKGHTVTVVPIISLENFITEFNKLGSDGSTIDTVVLFFHGNTDRIAFSSATQPREFDTRFIVSEHMDRITNENQINRIIFLGCYTGSGDENIAREFANMTNITSVIASDGRPTIVQRPINRSIRLRHMPSDTDGRYRLFTGSSGSITIGSNFSTTGRLIREANKL